MQVHWPRGFQHSVGYVSGDHAHVRGMARPIVVQVDDNQKNGNPVLPERLVSRGWQEWKPEDADFMLGFVLLKLTRQH